MAEIAALSAQNYDIGRYALFRQPVWDGTTSLFDGFVHVGTTEGALDPEMNPEWSDLTLETTGPALIRRLLSGERPEFTIGMFANPTNIKTISPTGLGSSGATRRREPPKHTLWLAPEELFLAQDANGFMVTVDVSYQGGAFVKDDPDGGPRALTVKEQYYADLSYIVWVAHFSRLTPVYNNDNGGKSLKDNVTVSVIQDLTKPDGCQNFLAFGELELFTIDIEPGS